MKTKWTVIIIIILVLSLGTFIIIKLNHPAAVGVRKFFSFIGSLTIVDSNKIKEYDKQVADYQEEINKLQKDFKFISEERTKDSLALVKEKEYSKQIQNRFQGKITALESELEQFRNLQPSDVLEYLDYLTGIGLESVLYIIENDTLGIIDINRIKFAIEKILQANSYAEQIIELEDWVANLERQVSRLENINAGLSLEKTKLSRELILTVQQRDTYRRLYLESDGKVRRSTIVAYGISGIAVLLFLLTL